MQTSVPYGTVELCDVTVEGSRKIAAQLGIRGVRSMLKSDLEAAILANGDFQGLHF